MADRVSMMAKDGVLLLIVMLPPSFQRVHKT
jgi:hypothetical protein